MNKYINNTSLMVGYYRLDHHFLNFLCSVSHFETLSNVLALLGCDVWVWPVGVVSTHVLKGKGMERPQVETVLQTLYTLYKASPNDLSRQAAANEWLTQLQKSVRAAIYCREMRPSPVGVGHTCTEGPVHVHTCST